MQNYKDEIDRYKNIIDPFFKEFNIYEIDSILDKAIYSLIEPNIPSVGCLIEVRSKSNWHLCAVIKSFFMQIKTVFSIWP